jgi:hypothetical protein
MRLTLRPLTLLLLVAGGCGGATAVAQESVPSHEAGANPRFIEESDLPDNNPHYPTAAQLGLRYTGAVQADSSVIADMSQRGLGGTGTTSPASVRSDTSYLTIDAPSAIAAREAAEAASATDGVIAAPRSNDIKLQSEFQRNTDCENGTLHGKPCRVSWWRVLSQSFYFLSTQHLGNIGLDHDTRNALERGNFWGNYAYCVEHYRWSRWKDDDPFLVDYVGHPMMGAVTSSIYEQNDPKQRALMFENTQRYWMGRLRAMAYSAAYSAQWKVGPLSEASIGSTGLFYYTRARDGIWTNETGMQDFFITPIGGMAWNVGEDVIDRYILRHVRHARRNKWVLLASSLTTPGKSAANLTRFRAPYYRDYDMETAGALAR